MFLAILAAAQRYAPRSHQSLATLVAAGVENFSWRPLWEGLIVQNEPFGWLLGATALFSMRLAGSASASRNRILPVTLVAMVALTGTLHLFVFMAASDHPFRPPYAGYLLPGLILVAALGIDNLYRHLQSAELRRPFIYVLFGLIAGLAIPSVLDFKATPKRADWRNVASLCENRYDQRHVLIFGTLGGAAVWKPTFFGFPRYYNGTSSFAEVGRLARSPGEWPESNLVPVLILFEYDDYLLTSRSVYPVLQGHPTFRLDRSILSDSSLKVFEFRGMWVIEPAVSAADFRDNLALMVQAIQRRLPDNQARREWDELAGALASSPVDNGL
jgi:hypothetical protein